jgi:hypothetical protein
MAEEAPVEGGRGDGGSEGGWLEREGREGREGVGERRREGGKEGSEDE